MSVSKTESRWSSRTEETRTETVRTFEEGGQMVIQGSDTPPQAIEQKKTSKKVTKKETTQSQEATQKDQVKAND